MMISVVIGLLVWWWACAAVDAHVQQIVLIFRDCRINVMIYQPSSFSL
jgi:hypothetical protein